MTKNRFASDLVRRIDERRDAALSTASAGVFQTVHLLIPGGEATSAADLASLIDSEPELSSQVIQVAKTLGYNPQRVAIDSIEQAISTIGLKTVRNLAISLLLVADWEKRLPAEELNGPVSLALASGCLAREIASWEGSVDPDLEFVSAVLRNHARLLLVRCLSDDSDQSRSAVARPERDEIYHDVFGFNPVELSFHLFRAQKLPAPLQLSIEKMLPYVVTTAAFTDEDEVLALGDLSLRLCQILATGEVETELFAEQAEVAIEDVAVTQRLHGMDVIELFKQLRKVDTSNLEPWEREVRSSGLFQRMDGFSNSTPPMKPESQRALLDPGSGTLGASRMTSGPGFAADRSAEARGMSEAGVRRLEDFVRPRGATGAQLYEWATQILSESLGLLHCLVFLPDSATSPLYARFGFGSAFEEQRNRPLSIGLGSDIIGVALSRSEDVLIENPNDRRIQPFIPDWLSAIAGDRPIILLPIPRGVIGKGLICGISHDLESFQRVARSAAETRRIRALLAGAEGGALLAP